MDGRLLTFYVVVFVHGGTAKKEKGGLSTD